MGWMRILSAIGAACTLVAACGHIAIYDSADPATRRNVGLEVYTPRPYIMVARTKAKDNPVAVSVVYLPDLQNPRYVHLQPGFIGTSKLGVTVNNGMVTGLNAETDSQIDDLLTAYGGLATSLAEAAKMRDDIDAQQQLRNQASQLPAAVQALADTITDLDAILARPSPTLLTNEVTLLRGYRTRLQTVHDSLDSGPGPTLIPQNLVALNGVARDWERGIRRPDALPERDRSVLARLEGLRARVQAVIEALSPTAPATPEFTLYEIVRMDNRTTLREVIDASVREAALNASQPAN